jgi:hypothetical protein
MKSRLAILPLIAALAGCAGANVGLRAGDQSLMRSAVAPGTSYSYAAVQAEANPNAYFGMFFLGSYLLGAQGDLRHWDQRASGRRPPEMAAERSVVERDCSKPLGQIEANLRCK